MAKNNALLRAKIQELIDLNTARACGDFHSDELDEDSFISALQKKFKVTSGEEGDIDDLLRDLIANCTKKVRGRMSARELKVSKFMKELLNKFEIEKL